MFSIGEKVMYGGTGVCVVEEITSVKFSASQPGKPYYLLRPMYQTGTIQTPADSGKVPIRPVMNRSEAEAVIDAMPTVPAEICTEKNLSALRTYYQKQITRSTAWISSVWRNPSAQRRSRPKSGRSASAVRTKNISAGRRISCSASLPSRWRYRATMSRRSLKSGSAPSPPLWNNI